jgi:hypothetical protein
MFDFRTENRQLRTDNCPEDELCLLLVRSELSPPLRERALGLLASPLRWPLVLQRARRYDILPLLYRRLQTLEFSGVPAPVAAQLANIFRRNAMRNELLAAELSRILGVLGDAGVPVMPLKGIALAERLYEDPALRTAADTDILVPAQNVAHAFHLIVASGYEPELSAPALFDLLARYGKDCSLTREDRACVYPLELHCGLIWGGSIERELQERIWSEALRKPFRGVTAFALSPEWEFLYLAVHSARHGWISLKWFIDLDRLCLAGRLDWEKVGREARLLGWERALQSSLSVCSTLLGTPVPAPLGFAGPLQLAERRAGRVPRPSNFQVASEILFHMSLLGTPGRKVRYLLSRLLVPTPADCEFVRLPLSMFFLYYLLRPIRVTCKTVGWLIRFGGSKAGLGGG